MHTHKNDIKQCENTFLIHTKPTYVNTEKNKKNHIKIVRSKRRTIHNRFSKGVQGSLKALNK